MTPGEVYSAIVKAIAWRHLKVIEIIGEKIKSGLLIQDSIIDYLSFWADVYTKIAKDEEAELPERPLSVINFDVAIAYSVKDNFFTDDEWQKCRMAMIGEYMRLDPNKWHTRGVRELLTDPRSRESIRLKSTILKDAHELTPNEIFFEEYLRVHFDPIRWCKEARVVYDPKLDKWLEYIYLNWGKY